jgi:NAD(P)H-nitrite reductase large subunit
VYVHECGFYKDQEIELLLDTSATSIDVDGASVTLDARCSASRSATTAPHFYSDQHDVGME